MSFLLDRKIQWSKILNLASTRITNATWMLDDSMKLVRHERQSGRFSKSRGLSASVSFLPLPLPSLFSRGNSLPLNPGPRKCLLRRLDSMPLRRLWIEIQGNYRTSWSQKNKTITPKDTFKPSWSDTHSISTTVNVCTNCGLYHLKQ